jgi:hypothetical protein
MGVSARPKGALGRWFHRLVVIIKQSGANARTKLRKIIRLAV